MDAAQIKSISQDVYRQFPELAGIQPKVLQQATPTNASGGSQTFLLTYKGQARLPDQKTLPRWVRVIVNDQGKILKITTSR